MSRLALILIKLYLITFDYFSLCLSYTKLKISCSSWRNYMIVRLYLYYEIIIKPSYIIICSRIFKFASNWFNFCFTISKLSIEFSVFDLSIRKGLWPGEPQANELLLTYLTAKCDSLPWAVCALSILTGLNRATRRRKDNPTGECNNENITIHNEVY